MEQIIANLLAADSELIKKVTIIRFFSLGIGECNAAGFYGSHFQSI